MGYYVFLEEANFVIPENEQVLQVLKYLNDSKNDAVKRDRSFGPGGKVNYVNYSWMPHDYDQKAESAQQVFEWLGFETQQRRWVNGEPTDEMLQRTSRLEHETGAQLPCSWPQCPSCEPIRDGMDDYYNAFALTGYDSKTGQEDLFVAAAAQFVKPGSFLQWKGEEGERWRQVVTADHSVEVQYAMVVWPS